MDPPPQFYPDSHLSKGTKPRKRILGQESKPEPSSQAQRKPAMKRNTVPRGSGSQSYQQGSTQLFDDTSTVPQQHMQPGGFPGQNMINDPMVANMALQYGTSLASHGREYVDQHMNKWISVSKLKYYFAVDTSYVVKKLGLVLFPYTHQNWAVKYNKAEPVAPRYEVNAPDLYIPVMAFVTYVLVAGLVLGTQNRFTPEQLGITATSALIWLFVEMMAIYLCLYICSVSSEIKCLDLVALCGYKYVGMIISALSGLMFGTLGYYIMLLWTCISTAFFVVRTLRLIILPEAADEIGRASKRRIYLLLFIAVLQPFFMYFLTRHLAPPSLVPVE